MKKFSKILSSVLATSMVVSCFAMSAMAASKAHTVTIKPSKTEGLVAGETIVVELTMDNTEALVNTDYVLNYDTTAFEVNTTKVSRVEACIDKTWLDGIKDTDGDWGYYLGSPTYNVAEAGKFQFQWAGSEGIEAEYALDNRVIGKFNIIVKADAPNGEYAFTLTGKTMDAGENSTADIVCAPVTVKVGAPAPAAKEVGFETTLAYDGVSKGFQFVATNTETGVTATSEVKALPTVENLGDVKLGCNIVNVPEAEVETVKSVVSMFARWVAELN
jgi:hypothetical protein